MDILENFSELGNNIKNSFDMREMQENFIKSSIGQIANTAIDIGLRGVLPDCIENEIIDVKNAIINGGIKEGINEAIEKTIDIGKKILGIGDTEFSSIDQAKETIEVGDLNKNISNAIDFVLEKISGSSIIPDSILNIIKNGKDVVLNNINTNVEDEFVNELKAMKKIEKYINNWEKCYSKKDVEGLNKEYSKIEKQMKKIMPIKDILNKINSIKSVNELIKNSENFDFNNMYLELAKSL